MKLFINMTTSGRWCDDGAVEDARARKGRFGETDLKRLRSNALIGDKNAVAKTWRGKK